MNIQAQKNLWSGIFWRGFAFLLVPMFVTGSIFLIPAETHASYAWHTFYGSSGEDSGWGIVLDKTGNIFITGYCNASWLGDGGVNPLHPHSGGNDIFVMKLDPNGVYQWHTFYGGSDSDGAYGIALDGSGNVLIVGSSSSTWQGDGGANPLHPHSGGSNSDMVVVKLNNNGVYQWHTFYGSSNYDGSGSVAVDGGGNIYVVGTSKGAWQGDGDVNPLHDYNGLWDMVVLKLGHDGSYQWHTFYGSGSYDGGTLVALDKGGSIFIAGTSEGSWQGEGGVNALHPYSGDRDIAVIKLNSSGAYQWHTFYGSSGSEQTYGIALDGHGNVHVTAESWANWKAEGGSNPLHPHSGENNYDMVVVKLNPNGSYQWHTFYGCAEDDSPGNITIDDKGNVYVAGLSKGSWQGDGGVDPLHTHGGGSDIVVLKLESSGAYEWHSFYGSGGQEYGWGITVDGNGNVHIVGEGKAAWQGDGGENPLHPYGGGDDIIVLKLYAEGLQPKEGTIGTQMTITGSGYGARKGKVLLGSAVLKILEWSDSTIRALLSKMLPSGIYDVTIQPKARGSDPIIMENAFTVKPPEIGSVEPSHGVINDEITLKGLFGGTKRGKITLGGKNCRIKYWTMDPTTGTSEALFVVPRGLSAGIYELKMTNSVGSDTTTFTVE